MKYSDLTKRHHEGGLVAKLSLLPPEDSEHSRLSRSFSPLCPIIPFRPHFSGPQQEPPFLLLRCKVNELAYFSPGELRGWRGMEGEPPADRGLLLPKCS